MNLKIHPRTRIVDKARHEFEAFLLDLEQKHELTYGELYSMLGGKIVDLAKYHIRFERHPESPDKKGDEA